MLIHEYRVVLPLTVEEYQVAQLYAISEMSKDETGGGEGIEIVKNEPFDNLNLLDGKYTAGQYTMKIYHVEKKIPALIKLLVPKGSLQVHEECWNAYPYSKTVLTNPGYMKEGFTMAIESFHHDDRAEQENILDLPPDVLSKREVTTIDIANDPISSKDYSPVYDPTTFSSAKTGRGPLTGSWIETTTPVMTCYKVVSINFKWFGLQRKVEQFMQKFEQRVFTVFHRRVFCSMDEWYGLTMEDVRKIEEETRSNLDRERLKGHLRGIGSTHSLV